MKKYLLLFLTVILAFSLAACNGGKKPGKTTNPGGGHGGGNEFFGGKTAEEWQDHYKDIINIDKDGNGIPDWQETEMTITWAGRIMFDELEENVIHRLALDWAKQYPNITIVRDGRFLNSTGNDWEQLDMMVAASLDNTFPDIFVTYMLAEYYDQGLTLDITPYLRSDEDAHFISDGALDYMTSFDGKEMTGSVYAYYPDVMQINLDILEEYNIPVPSYEWTYEEYEELRSAVGAITESRDICLFPGYGDFLDTGANYFDGMPYGRQGFNIETMRYELEKAPKWGEWQEQWIDEIDRGWHMWDLTEQRREELCGDKTWDWGDGFIAVAKANFWDLNMEPQDLKINRGMNYEVYPIPKAPEGGETSVYGWMDTISLSYELEGDRVKAEAVYDLLKFLTHGLEGKRTLYSYLDADLEKYGTSVEDFVEKGGDAADFPTTIYPGNVMMDYTFGWPTSTNPELLELHPWVKGFDTGYEKLDAYNFEAFKLPYFQQQLSNGKPNILRHLPGLNRTDGHWVRHEILQDMRDEGYGWNDLAPAMSDRMNQILDDYVSYYNNVN